ncbi:hypothetical protein D3C85_850690 [compost metagenome]
MNEPRLEYIHLDLEPLLDGRHQQGLTKGIDAFEIQERLGRRATGAMAACLAVEQGLAHLRVCIDPPIRVIDRRMGRQDIGKRRTLGVLQPPRNVCLDKVGVATRRC